MVNELKKERKSKRLGLKREAKKREKILQLKLLQKWYLMFYKAISSESVSMNREHSTNIVFST